MKEQRITPIPFPGGSGLTPTGAMQFQDDWPGLFIRGDDAMMVAGCLRQIEQLLRDKRKAVLPSMLAEIVEIIERDVIVRRQGQS